MKTFRLLSRALAHTVAAVAAIAACAVVARAQQQSPPPTKSTSPASQQLPLPAGVTPANAAQLLQARPDLGNVVRQRLQESGMTPDQVRARLRAAGYPSDLLDQYMSPDSLGLTPPPPSQSALRAIASLGVTTFTTQDSLLLAGDTLALRMYQDSLRLDSIRIVDSVADRRRGLRLFGLETFRQPSTQFQPIVSGPVSDDYRLGPGDQLVLILTGAVETTEALEVTREGLVVIPLVGQVFVNSLTLGQLREVLFTRLSRVYSGITRGPDTKTRFQVTVARIRTQTLRVVGEVVHPGSYQIAATGSVLTALYQVGGLTENSNFRAIEVRRGADLIGTVDLYNYLLHGVTPTDVALASGDVVFVPMRGGRVKVAGEVRRPGIYEIKTGESLRDLIQIAGGLTALAVPRSATIDRVVPLEQRRGPDEARTVVTVALGDILRPATPPVPIFDADSVTVFATTTVRRNAVIIKGGVWQPGTYQVAPGMRLWDLVQAAGGLKPGTYRGRAQITRMRPDSSHSLIGVPLPDSGVVPTPNDNPALQEFDLVTIYDVTDFRPKRYLAVYGAVRKPGLVPFADSMSLRDAVLMAGGLLEDAYLVSAEISRLRPTAQGSGDSLAAVVRVPLDSTYVVDTTGHLGRAVGATKAPLVPLEPYDNVFIRRQPGWELQRNVVLTGEVNFPGRYSLITKDERLLSLIRRAGGLTPQAYANGIRFFRADGAAGRIGVDLPRVLRDPSYKDNVLLTAGDSIQIPRYIPTVRVDGAVNSPSSVTYVPGADVDYYIDAGGGVSRFADKGRTFVQQPNGSIERGKRPEPGAVVVVPLKDPNAKGTDWVSLITGITGIAASLATVIVVLTR